MFELNKAEDLSKAGKSIGSFFHAQSEELGKSQSFHKAMCAMHKAASEEHDGLSKRHAEHAELHKSAAAALDDGHELKAHHAAKHELHKRHASHHDALAKTHKDIADAHDGHADHFKSQVDALKTMAGDFGVTKADASTSTLSRLLANRPTGVTPPTVTPSGNVMVDMINDTSAQLMAKTLTMMDTDPEVQKAMREHVMKLIAEAVGSTVVPTNVSAIAPPNVTVEPFGIRAIPRAGAKTVPSAAVTPAVAMEFAKLFATDDGVELR